MLDHYGYQQKICVFKIDCQVSQDLVFTWLSFRNLGFTFDLLIQNL